MDLTYRFCPQCAGVLELREVKASEPMRPVCTRCGQVIYLDPKVAVGTIIADDTGRLVLVRRAIREAKEEAGLDIRLDSLVNIYSYPGRPLVVIVYAATRTAGDLCVDEESLEAQWFAPPEIPWDELAFQSTREGLSHYLEGFRLQK